MRESDHRFRWFLCRTFGRLPDDPWFDSIDPIMWTWMYYSWAEDSNDTWEMMKNQAYTVAQFIDSEGVRKAMGVGGQTHTSTDAEVDEVLRKLTEDNRKAREAAKAAAATATEEGKPTKKRRKRHVVEE